MIRASQEIYFNKFSNENNYYNIEKFYEKFNIYYFADFFFIIVTSVFYIFNKVNFSLTSHFFNTIRLNLA